MLHILALLAIWFLTTLDKWPSYPPMFDIRDYGILTDGRDCLGVILECFDDVPVTGGIIWFPPSTYNISTPKRESKIVGYKRIKK